MAWYTMNAFYNFISLYNFLPKIWEYLWRMHLLDECMYKLRHCTYLLKISLLSWVWHISRIYAHCPLSNYPRKLPKTQNFNLSRLYICYILDFLAAVLSYLTFKWDPSVWLFIIMLCFIVISFDQLFLSNFRKYDWK